MIFFFIVVAMFDLVNDVKKCTWSILTVSGNIS